MFKIRMKEDGEIKATASTMTKAKIKIQRLENEDRENGWYIPDSYEILEVADKPKRTYTENDMPCLCVKAPYAGQIVAGTKTTEYRTSLTAKRGRIGIIQSGTGTIIGDVEITGADWGKEFAEWHLQNARRYKHPIPYKHPYGAVIWVRVHITQDQIQKALSD